MNFFKSLLALVGVAAPIAGAQKINQLHGEAKDLAAQALDVLSEAAQHADAHTAAIGNQIVGLSNVIGSLQQQKVETHAAAGQAAATALALKSVIG